MVLHVMFIFIVMFMFIMMLNLNRDVHFYRQGGDHPSGVWLIRSISKFLHHMIHHASNHQPVHLDDDNDKLTIKIFTHKIFPMMSGDWQRLIKGAHHHVLLDQPDPQDGDQDHQHHHHDVHPDYHDGLIIRLVFGRG